MTVLTHPTAAHTRTDEELVALLRAGRPEAFETVVARYQAPLTAFARGLMHGAHHDAEEAVQDALVRALLALRRDERPVALKPWLHAIVRNACLDRLRRPVRTTALEPLEPLLGDAAADPHAALLRREELAALVQDLRLLPARQRIALVGHELEGRSHEQLAGELDVSVGASKALVCRARQGLAQLRAAA
ncbi:MAG: sigma-70 family polymerase sigma factor [Solirubrobacterales bacterium]|jgi:RNA polymerase sigma-70 factor (ECF subfamily)|nr:sigma-70 family polymerase sigma factor [Solirubrobacterales bacterium]